MKTKRGVIKAALSAGVHLEDKDVTVTPARRKKHPVRRVVRFRLEVTPAKRHVPMAILECGHVVRMNRYGGRCSVACPHCPDE